MVWQDRIREAAYTSPSGARLPFIYEDVGRSVDKKTTAFTFPDADGTYIQDLGRTGYQYPLRLIFSGDNYDTETAAFEAALLEPGTGVLEHPAYGSIDVVPFGTITRRDDLKTAANQAIVEVTFWETIGIIYPTGQTDAGSAVLDAVTEFNNAIAEQTADNLPLDTAVQRASFKATYTSFLDSVNEGLQPITDAQADVARTFNTIEESINEGIDTLIADPLSLAFQTVLLIQSPARALTDITARLTAYTDLATSITSGTGASVTRDLFAMSSVSGSVLSAVNHQFNAKPDALQAATDILDQFDSVVTWRDTNLALDTGESYQQLQEAVALVAGFLVEISFTLKQERRIVLDRARTIVDLSAELYGEVDGQLDFLIASNNLTGSEILELPRGREIVYYV